MTSQASATSYRGRIAPTPTGYLHLGHAATFQTAWRRARDAGGAVVMRIEDLDPARCHERFTSAGLEDLCWLGLDWDEGPDCGGPFGPYRQSERRTLYEDLWRRLKDGGWIYPCPRSRKDVAEASVAPHDATGGPLYPARWRPPEGTGSDASAPGGINWRFRVPDGEEVRFIDGNAGCFSARAGEDFGDFVVWRRDDVPAYELAVVADDRAMEISEVVRGEDLLLSTCRQTLIYRALNWNPPTFFHCPLVRDGEGKRLAKRTRGLSLRELRENGASPEAIRKMAVDRVG